MKKQYALPASVALGAHVLLLFGFTPPDRTRHLGPPDRDPLPPSDPIEIVTYQPERDRATTSDFASPARGTPQPVWQPDDAGPSQSPVTVPRPPMPDGPVRITTGPIDPSQLIPGDPDGDPIGTHGPMIVDRDGLDNNPQALVQTSPTYPYEARRGGLGGQVLVEFVVDEHGEVIHARVVRSDAQIFDQPALQAVAHWRFQPGRKDGRAVRFRMSVPLVFNVSEN